MLLSGVKDNTTPCPRQQQARKQLGLVCPLKHVHSAENAPTVTLPPTRFCHTLVSISEVLPMTCKAPSFFLGSRSSGNCSRIRTQNAMTGSRMFFRLWHAVWRKAWAATTGDTRSSNMSKKWGEGGKWEGGVTNQKNGIRNNHRSIEHQQKMGNNMTGQKKLEQRRKGKSHQTSFWCTHMGHLPTTGHLHHCSTSGETQCPERCPGRDKELVCVHEKEETKREQGGTVTEKEWTTILNGKNHNTKLSLPVHLKMWFDELPRCSMSHSKATRGDIGRYQDMHIQIQVQSSLSLSLSLTHTHTQTHTKLCWNGLHQLTPQSGNWRWVAWLEESGTLPPEFSAAAVTTPVPPTLGEHKSKHTHTLSKNHTHTHTHTNP